MSTDRERATDIKVGIFVTLGLALLTVSIFLIGQERNFFEEPVYLKALFPNVSGLKVGAPVRLAGYEIGIVSEIQLPESDPDAEHSLVPATPADTLAAGDSELAIEGSGELPIAMNVSVSAFDPKNQLQFTLRVEGEDAYGNEGLVEDLRVRVQQFRTTVTGRAMFKKVTKVEVRDLKGNGAGSSLQVGVGRTKKVVVVMRIPRDMLKRIRLDSEASVDSMGLLGDKTIDITIGSQNQPAHEDGDFVKSAVTVDLNAALADAQRILDNVVASTDELRRVMSGFSDAGGDEALAAAVRSIQAIAEEIQTGEGLLHQLVFDRQGGEQYKDIVTSLSSSAKKVDQSLAQVDKIIAEVRSGDGLVHELIYGKEGEATVRQAREALAQATQILEDVRTKEGVVHNLIYDEDRGEFITNLNEATADVKLAMKDVQQIVADVKAGKGTLGGLIVDPTVYEDLKVLLGNVRRNDAVKALVRAAIAGEDKKAAAPVEQR